MSFKAIPEEKPLEVIFMAPELQSKGELSEKVSTGRKNRSQQITIFIGLNKLGYFLNSWSSNDVLY